MRLMSMLLLLPAVASASPVQLTHQGRLVDVDGSPLNGSHSITVSLYESADSEPALFAQTFTPTLQDGYFSVVLDTNDSDSEPLDSELFTQAPRFVGVSTGVTALTGRSRLTATPYAARAVVADGVVVSDAATACEQGQLRYNDTTETLEVCDNSAWTATGGTTGLAAGTYENATITVDAQGRITAVSSGASSGAGIETVTVSDTTFSSWKTVSCPANYTLSGCSCRFLDDTTQFWDGFCEANSATSCRGKGHYSATWTFQVQAICIRLL